MITIFHRCSIVSRRSQAIVRMLPLFRKLYSAVVVPWVSFVWTTQGNVLERSPQVLISFNNASSPDPVNVHQDSTVVVQWTAQSEFLSTLHVHLLSSKEATLEGLTEFPITTGKRGYNVTIRGVLVGKTALTFSADQNDSSFLLPHRVLVNILRDAKSIKLDIIVTYLLAAVLVVFYCIGVGLATDIRIVLKVLKKPIGPVVGFCCQTIFMPLMAFALIKLFKITGVIAFGLFICGCVPGGGISNIFCVLLNGNIPLSATMTTISTFASLATLPLWLYTLGKHILKTNTNYSSVVIPFRDIAVSLVLLVIPTAIGIIIRYKKESISLRIIRVVKPIIIFVVLPLAGFLVYVNMYAWSYVTTNLVIACLVLPYGGYLISMGVAAALCQPWQNVFTIGIEAGFQNVQLSYILAKLIMESPDSELASIPPTVVMLVQALPLWVAVAIHTIWVFCCFKKGKCLALNCIKKDENIYITEEDKNENEKTDGGDTNKAFEENKDEVTKTSKI